MGKKNKGKNAKKGIRHLSRKWLHDTTPLELTEELELATDRTCAIVAATLVDSSLLQSLSAELFIRNNTHSERLFHGESGPFSTFSQRIAIARAIGLVDDDFEKGCNAIRLIRNAFAHTLIKLSFDDELIAKECNKLPEPTGLLAKRFETTKNENRRKYVATCILFSLLLTRHLVDETKKGEKNFIPKLRLTWPEKSELYNLPDSQTLTSGPQAPNIPPRSSRA